MSKFFLSILLIFISFTANSNFTEIDQNTYNYDYISNYGVVEKIIVLLNSDRSRCLQMFNTCNTIEEKNYYESKIKTYSEIMVLLLPYLKED
jgi:hypothetical protein